MRSPRGLAATLILLLGVVLAIIVGAALGDGAENVIHLALAACFILLAFAVFDFRLPTWFNLTACAVTGVLGAIFLLQGVSDLMQSPPLQHLAYDVLGQRLEKLLGYAFLLWCAGLLLRESTGGTRILGAVVLVAILAVEIYSFAIAYLGGTASDALKLLYLPLFVWLMLESMKPRPIGEHRTAPQRQP